MLDRAEPLRPGERRGGLVAVERAAVLARERLEIADRLVQRRRIAVAERERLAERSERLGVRVEVARVLAGAPVSTRPPRRRGRRAADAGAIAPGLRRVRARRRRGRAGAAGGRRSSARTRRGAPARGGTRARRRRSRRGAPRRVSSSSAVTVSSSLRPLTARIRSASNGRPSTAAAATTWPATSLDARRRAPRAGRARRAAEQSASSSDLRVEVLDDEERQSLRLLEQALRQLGEAPAAAASSATSSRLEPVEDDDVGEPVAARVGEDAARRMVRRRLLGAPGHEHEHRPVAEPADEEREHLERGRVGPVDVVDDEQARPLAARSPRAGRARRRRGSAPARRARRASASAACRAREGAAPPRLRLPDRPRRRCLRGSALRTSSIAQPNASSGLVLDTAGASPRRRRRARTRADELVGEPRLADPRLAVEHDEPSFRADRRVRLAAARRARASRPTSGCGARGRLVHGRSRPGGRSRRPRERRGRRAVVSSVGATPSSRWRMRTQSRYCASAAARSPLAP